MAMRAILDLGITTPTTHEQRALLKNTGFVHVTGLQTWFAERQYRVGEKLETKELGRWGSNNGVTCIVTLGGEVWISRARTERCEPAIRTLTSNGRGAFVPCSNGEQITTSDLLDRWADPDSPVVVD